MKRKDFIKRIGAAFAALVAWVKVNEGISEPIQTMHIGQLHQAWSRSYRSRDGITWEERTEEPYVKITGDRAVLYNMHFTKKSADEFWVTLH